MIMKDDIDSTKRIYEQVLEIRNFEIKELVQRNNFFMIFQGVLLASALQSNHSNIYYSLAIFIAGAGISYLQMRVAAGAKYWQENWEVRLKETEAKLLDLLESENKQLQLNFPNENVKRNHFYSLFQGVTDQENEKIRASLETKYNFSNWLIMQKPSVSRMPIFVSLWLLIIWTALILFSLFNISKSHTLTFKTFPIITEISIKK